MGKSYKKPYVTDQQRSPYNKIEKRSANKAVRNKSENEVPSNGKAYRKEYNSYNIRDYSFHCPNDKKAYRK